MILKINRFDFGRANVNVNRLLAIDKIGLKNTYSIPSFDRIVLTITLQELDDFDDIKLISSAFALFLISGRRPYITRFGVFQTFRTTSCDVILTVTLTDEFTICEVFQFISCQVLVYVSKHDLQINEFVSETGLTGIFFSLANLNFLKVIETHYIFFRWYERLHVRVSSFFATKKLMFVFFSFFKFFKKKYAR